MIMSFKQRKIKFKPRKKLSHNINKRPQISFSLSKLGCGCQENSREIRLHLPFSANWNNATKIEKTAIHFKTDVFAAVTVVDAKAP